MAQNAPNNVVRRTLSQLVFRNAEVMPPDYIEAYVDHDGALWLLHDMSNCLIVRYEDVPKLIAFLQEFLEPNRRDEVA